ncbi:transferase hexapeptide (six repeat-containing protein) [Novosphingobium sp. CF614]|uniref:DapH/DapD/GlmU-related protein n=1 Tax=Novosphingobium sp. CF614 TaxID=1884364 RepID=UPI0008F1E3C9|nr:DapH/DapD/GlmU-related protein [Novosphingobium sp. CF614]SFF94700.1 transferase hexapeptide (six repeat-containing protein) [Novosphingobium sp. CF614]
MPSRAVPADLPAPERAADAVIARCRAGIEGRCKRAVRACLVRLLRRRHRLAELGEGLHWGRNIRLAPGSRIGRFAYLGADFECHGPIVIGDLCMLAAGCKIVGADHLYDIAGLPTRLAFAERPRPATILGADVWLGQRVTVMEGVSIGTGAVIGAGAVVTRDVPPYAVMAGLPARRIRWRFGEDTMRRHHAEVIGGEMRDFRTA